MRWSLHRENVWWWETFCGNDQLSSRDICFVQTTLWKISIFTLKLWSDQFHDAGTFFSKLNSGPKTQLSNCYHYFWKGDLSKFFKWKKNRENCCQDRTGIVAPKIGPEGFELWRNRPLITFEFSRCLRMRSWKQTISITVQAWNHFMCCECCFWILRFYWTFPLQWIRGA